MKTLKTKGFSGLYSGIVPPLYGQMIFRAAGFGSFHYAVNYLSNGNISCVSTTQLFQAGAITGFVGMILRYFEYNHLLIVICDFINIDLLIKYLLSRHQLIC